MINREEKCVVVALCWIQAIVTYLLFTPLVPEEIIPIIIMWKIWLFMAVPVIMVVAHKLGY